MDPNETLRELRQAYSDYEDTRGRSNGPAWEAADRMRDAAAALDEWLCNGGFLPDAWHSKANLPKGGCATPGCKRCANAPE